MIKLLEGIICKSNRIICNNCKKTLDIGDKCFSDGLQIDYHLCQNCKNKL